MDGLTGDAQSVGDRDPGVSLRAGAAHLFGLGPSEVGAHRLQSAEGGERFTVVEGAQCRGDLTAHAVNHS